MSSLINKIIYSNKPLDINCVLNIYTPNVKTINSFNCIIFDRSIVNEGEKDGLYKIIYEYVFDGGIVHITDQNLESKTVVIHSEALLYQLIKGNKKLLKYFEPIEKLIICTEKNSKNQNIDFLAAKIKCIDQK